jgi:hypothetical protein
MIEIRYASPSAPSSLTTRAIRTKAEAGSQRERRRRDPRGGTGLLVATYARSGRSRVRKAIEARRRLPRDPFKEVDPTIQSRACGGGERTYAACPVARHARRLDGILKWQLDSRHRPCNFVEIMPRLRETAASEKSD